MRLIAPLLAAACHLPAFFFEPSQAFSPSVASPGVLARVKPNDVNFKKDERRIPIQLNGSANDESSNESAVWNPKLRRTLGVIASVGAVETAYLTFNKITRAPLLLCGGGDDAASACSSILDGPYSYIPGTQLPLALLGFAAYATVGFLAVAPLKHNAEANVKQEDDLSNRLLLTCLSTAMGLFSLFLLTILYKEQAVCGYCILSAVLSISLAKLAWLGGAVPPRYLKQEGLQWGGSGAVAAATVAAALIFATPQPPADATTPVATSTQVLAASSSEDVKLQSPPPILTSSSPRALQISKDLESLNARFYGAFWCSHCYDQKERLGKEAMARIPYIECSRDGVNSQVSLCKERKVPGYPTWEINGKLFPGERELDELESLIREEKQ